MEVSICDVSKKNSFVRSMFKTSIFWTCLIPTAVLTSFLPFYGLIIGSLVFASLSREILTQSICKSFLEALKLQEQAIEEYQPDLIVGSSWGGAITSALILQGTWKGNTLLLAPAFHYIDELADVTSHLNIADWDYCGQIKIVHSKNDKTIPIEHSRKLRSLLTKYAKNVELIEMEDAGGHSLREITKDNQLKTLIQSFKQSEL